MNVVRVTSVVSGGSGGSDANALLRAGLAICVLAATGCARTRAHEPPPTSAHEPALTNVAPRVPVRHRAEPIACSQERVAGDRDPLVSQGCKRDAECTRGRNGRCARVSYDVELPNACYYDACYADRDCPANTACVCGPGWADEPHACRPSGCRVDRDCGANGFCSPTPTPCGGTAGWYCHGAGDTCLDDSDCRTPSRCAYDKRASAWRCDAGPSCK